MAFTIKGGKFSTTDDDRTIRQSPVDEVIDILTAPTVGSGPPRGAPARAMQPQRQAPVNVGMMPERRGNVNIPMGQSTFVNVPGRSDEKQVQTPLKVVSPFTTKRNPVGSVDDVLFNLSLSDAAGQPINYGGGEDQLAPANVSPLTLASYGGGEGQLSGSFTNYPGGEGYRELVQGDKAAAPYTGIEQILARQAQGQGQGLGAINPYEQFGDPLLGGDASTILGVNAFDKRAAELLGYDMETMEGVTKYLNDTKRSMENQERDQRLDDERRERAAMLAAQQQQPVDPCPEGYRMDPVSKVCVPVDDTTQPDNLAPRTYDTMTRPEPNYTAATGATLPVITLPDILG